MNWIRIVDWVIRVSTAAVALGLMYQGMRGIRE